MHMHRCSVYIVSPNIQSLPFSLSPGNCYPFPTSSGRKKEEEWLVFVAFSSDAGGHGESLDPGN